MTSLSSGARPSTETDYLNPEMSPDTACAELMKQLPRELRAFYFGSTSHPIPREDCTDELVDLLLDISRPGPLRHELEMYASANEKSVTLVPSDVASMMMVMERRIQRAFRAYGPLFPSSIWDCCSKCCFTMLVVDRDNFELFDEILRIHGVAERLHGRVEKRKELVPTRRRGVGGSSMTHSAPSRVEREMFSGVAGTDRQRALRELSDFVTAVLPFLYGLQDSPSGTPKPRRKLCTESICCLLGVSKNFLYGRKRFPTQVHATDEELYSLVDTSGVRLRQLRRRKDRTGFPEVPELQSYQCGCGSPCFTNADQYRLHIEYEQFVALSLQLRPRRKENQYLLNAMFCPLMNPTVKICDTALSALYTVSVSVISDVRRVLEAMCQDPSIEDMPILQNGLDVYTKSPLHPANRYPDYVRERVETHLDMMLRADPGASDGVHTYRVYSPEINTSEKLRNSIAKHLEGDDGMDVRLSSSTLQRMVNDFLKSRNSRIKFLQSDHNACPTCKTLQYALLQFSYDVKSLEAQKAFAERTNSLRGEPRENTESLQAALTVKQYQEDECLKELEMHNLRDKNIRRVLKRFIDHFRKVENSYRAMESDGGHAPKGWRQRLDSAMITHQDDMTKVDLPSFIVTASSDITRWRFDVNAHVNAVTDDSIVFSHEQGGGAKNGSSICELILLDHILRCRGEGIKFVVSDNASVGKNWLTSIAFPQYLVDQGLADVVVILFLENNHGKWLADMLFGQLQIRRRKSTILGIDGLLDEFESINRKSGSVQGFAINPLACVDFSKILDSLGYQTKPSKEFGFLKRNIHFAAACAPGAANRLPIDAKRLMGDLLPSEPGMVRICSEPPSSLSQSELPYESRYVDVPAAKIDTVVNSEDLLTEVPLVVPLDQKYSASGSGVVSHRNMNHVGFNGFEFRKSKACPELSRNEEPIIRQAWPVDLLQTGEARVTTEGVDGETKVKCAPENWIVRRPVSQFRGQEGQLLARYPPRNMINAKHERPPRASDDCEPTATYCEPPFPLNEKTSALAALRDLMESHRSIGDTLNIMDIFRTVYKDMGDREFVSDRWLQKNATRASEAAVVRYRNQLRVFVEREKGHPRAPMTVKQAFKSDPTVNEQASRTLRENASDSTRRETLSKIKDRMFTEAEKRPGVLDRYIHAAEKDHERYASELKIFKEVTQRQFDEDNGLFPVRTTVEDVE